MKKETEIWLSIAAEDFKNMQSMIDTGSLRGAVLFAQQSVEKIVKAYISEFTVNSPKRIHFIEILIQDAGLDLEEIGNPDVKKLSQAYGWARYKDLSSSHFNSIDDVSPLIIIAQKVYPWILEKFQKM